MLPFIGQQWSFFFSRIPVGTAKWLDGSHQNSHTNTKTYWQFTGNFILKKTFSLSTHLLNDLTQTICQHHSFSPMVLLLNRSKVMDMTKGVPHRCRSSTDTAHLQDVISVESPTKPHHEETRSTAFQKKTHNVYWCSHGFCWDGLKTLIAIFIYHQVKRACSLNLQNKGFLLILDLQHWFLNS